MNKEQSYLEKTQRGALFIPAYNKMALVQQAVKLTFHRRAELIKATIPLIDDKIFQNFNASNWQELFYSLLTPKQSVIIAHKRT